MDSCNMWPFVPGFFHLGFQGSFLLHHAFSTSLFQWLNTILFVDEKINSPSKKETENFL